MKKERRNLAPSLGELIDRMTVDQVKEIARSRFNSDYDEEMKVIERDLNSLLTRTSRSLSGELIHLVIALAQVNLYIWQARESRSGLKLAHQLNGVRNQLKNRIDQLHAGKKSKKNRTNTATDGLKDFTYRILNR